MMISAVDIEIDLRIAEYRGSRLGWSDASIYQLVVQELGRDHPVALRFARDIVSGFDLGSERDAYLASAEFLLSPEWRRLRMRALERDGGSCACCGRTAADGIRLNVDHIKPRLRYPDLALSLDNLQVLCHECNHGKGNCYETDWRASAP
jgi:hypothetical protein